MPRSRSISSWVGLSVGLGCSVLLGVRAATSPCPPAGRRLSEAERSELARELAREEPIWQRRAELKFPGDLWSQDDDFFNQEHHRVRALSAAHGTSPSELLLGIDQELRARPAGRKVTVSPCKPRPFYD